MSIPPLVCSTPPPPDQCEEDKDPDDFDIPYNLSQDDNDDEDSFGYGDFSSFNHYQSNFIAQKKDMITKNEVGISIHQRKQEDVVVNNLSVSKESDAVFGTNTLKEKPKSEEDTNIEDLDLEINEDSASSSEKEDESEENSNIEISEKILEVEDVATDDNIPSRPSKEHVVETSSGDVVEPTSIDYCKENLDNRSKNDTSLDLNVYSSVPNSSSNDEICEHDLHLKENSASNKDLNLDDDFGDFDDFHFVSAERKASSVIDNCDNPWETNVADNGDDFGNFTANFEPIKGQASPISVSDNIEENIQANPCLESSPVQDNDDFGDFDDFKSSIVENEMVETGDLEPDQHLPVLNFQASDSEHQVMESITKVLVSIFEVEISEPKIEFEERLESKLSETWRHLRETDVRQPYIINWNNSLGQKTLLRALCIDSRNILFGPKWGYNMPKYAVNLSAAPLQPQKPLTLSSSSQCEPVVTEKPTATSGGWTDPFTADGQEFTYAEALLLDLEHLMATLDQMAHNHSTLKISELLSHACNTESESVVEVTSTDLDVFEAAISSKADNKIYSSTLNVQPLRQISLPDTHIFTPTDSEIPTSKTVHYDSGPPILMPKTVLESGKQAESSTTQHLSDTTKDSKDEDDYWEFQDFKSSSENTTATTPSSASQPQLTQDTKTENGVSKPNVTYQTQVLQPIRMEPLMPTVNWPDPGEIKETFDDFSDFVSNSKWGDNSQEHISIPQTENKPIGDTDKINDKHKNVAAEKDRLQLNSNEDFDDDFDTFQSALPQKHITSEFNFDNLGANTLQNIPSQNTTPTADFNKAFPKINSVKSDIISISNTTRRNEALTQNQANSDTKEPTFSKSSITLGNPISHSLLQPIPSSSNLTSQSKQKAGQILQPLSLESYSQINWPNPGIDLQDLSRFNPVETLQSLKTDLSAGGPSKVSSPVHNQKGAGNSQVKDDDWGDFVSSKPKQQGSITKKPSSFVDDEEWTDFVSSPTVKPQNGLNTISLNVHTNSNIQKTSNLKFPMKNNQVPMDIPTLNYITPKASSHNSYNDRHFQNL